VPGHPTIGESTVALLRAAAPQQHVDLRIVPAISFLDALGSLLPVDPLRDSVQIVDGLELATALDREPFGGGTLPISPLRPALVGQVYNAATASAGSMTLSATMRILAVRGFQMKNMTIANDYVEDSVTGNQTAVAALVQGDQTQFENVRFIGNIGTLYVKSTIETIAARSYFRDCYVEGDQDFITGRGVAVFDHTEVHVLTARAVTGASIAYPSTLVFNRYGFLFDSCKFTADTGASGVFLGRQWPETSDNAMGMSVGKMIVRNSTLGAHLAGAAPWSSMGARTTTPKDPTGTTPVVLYTSDDYFPAGVGPTPAEPFLGEYRNSGPGAH